MLFIVNWTISPENRNRALQRFVETKGAPPEGVKMLGRWHAVGRAVGFGIAETDDLALIQKWVFEWSDLMSMEVQPALTDAQATPLLLETLANK